MKTEFVCRCKREADYADTEHYIFTIVNSQEKLDICHIISANNVLDHNHMKDPESDIMNLDNNHNETTSDIEMDDSDIILPTGSSFSSIP